MLGEVNRLEKVLGASFGHQQNERVESPEVDICNPEVHLVISHTDQSEYRTAVITLHRMQ